MPSYRFPQERFNSSTMPDFRRDILAGKPTSHRVRDLRDDVPVLKLGGARVRTRTSGLESGTDWRRSVSSVIDRRSCIGLLGATVLAPPWVGAEPRRTIALLFD